MAVHNWFPGRETYRPEEQQQKSLKVLEDMTKGLNLELALDPYAIYTDAGIARSQGTFK